MKNYEDCTVKELKQILNEHNYSCPSGAKKEDLVGMVKELMEVDGLSEEVEEILEGVTEKIENIEEKLEEEVNDDSRPSMHSPEWNDYVMSHFEPHELVDGNPICAGLRRVAEKLLGTIVESGPDQVFPATEGDGPGRATVVFKVVFSWMDTGMMKVFKEVADVWHGNTDDLFCAHPVATASTRAEGRALRKALKIRCLAAEELARKDIVEIVRSAVTGSQAVKFGDTSNLGQEGKITTQQVQYLDNVCLQLDINAFSYINSGEREYDAVADIPKEKAKLIIRKINQYKNNKDLIPDGIKGYDPNWRN